MEDFFTIKINSKNYILVDEFVHNNTPIFCFATLTEEIFCKKVDNKYVQIKDKFEINLFKNKLGLISPTIIYNGKDNQIKKIVIKGIKYYQDSVKYKIANTEPLTAEENSQFFEEQIQNFKNIDKKFNLNLNQKKINKIFSKLKVLKMENSIREHARAFYNIKKNFIALETRDVSSKNPYSKQVRLHEAIHAQTFRHTSYFFRHRVSNLGILEGETEDLADKIFGNNTASRHFFKDSKKNHYNVLFNFPSDTSYKTLVSIVRQMQYVTGKNSYKSIIEGSLDFEKNFAKEYGIGLLIYINTLSKKLVTLDKKHLNNHIGTFKKIQDTLLRKVFDKDFSKVNSLDDAKQYLQKLRGFETQRGLISRIDLEKKVEIEDKTFEEYYNQKFLDVINVLESKGLSSEYISSQLKDFKYEKQPYNSIYTKEEEQNVVENIIVHNLIDISFEKNKKFDLNKYSFEYYKSNNENFFIIMNDKNTQEPYITFFNINYLNDEEKLLKDTISGETGSNPLNPAETKKFLEANNFKGHKIDISNKTEKYYHQELYDLAITSIALSIANLVPTSPDAEYQKHLTDNIENKKKLLGDFGNKEQQLVEKIVEEQRKLIQDSEKTDDNILGANLLNKIIKKGKNFVRTSKIQSLVEKISSKKNQKDETTHTKKEAKQDYEK